MSIDRALQLADAYANACFEQGLNQRTEDPAPESARATLVTELQLIVAEAKAAGACARAGDGKPDNGWIHAASGHPARPFAEWLNDQRMKDVSQVFHEIMARYCAALAAAPAAPNVPAGWVIRDRSDLEPGVIDIEGPGYPRTNVGPNPATDGLRTLHALARAMLAAPAVSAPATTPVTPRTADTEGGTWEENVYFLLSQCPYAVRSREGGGSEDLLSSLCITFTGMQMRLQGHPMFKKEAPAWQPIETAPKERGGLVDIICNERRYAGCHYDRICDEYRHITACGVLIRLKGATHWMQPPAAPGFPSPATVDGSRA
jgi:hypothetical protein